MLSAKDDRALKATVLAFKAADRDLRRDINTATRQTMNPVWRSLVRSNLSGTSAMTGKVLDTGVRIAAGNPPVAKAAQSTRNVGSGGRLIPRDGYAAWEFGAVGRGLYSRYTRRSKRGVTHQVERRTMRGLPRRVDSGRVVFPAFAEIAPRMVSLWVQIVVKKYHEAAEQRR